MSDTSDRIDDQQILDEPQPPTDPPEPNTDERPLTLREQMMAEIVRKRHASFLAESPQEDEPEADPEPPEHEPAHVEGHEPEPVVAAPAPPTEPMPPPHVPPQVVTLPNGLQVTADQAMTLAHMGFVAAQALSQPQQVAPVPHQRPVVDDALLSDTVHKMQFGSPDEGKAALGHLIQQVAGNIPQQTVDPNQVAAQATQAALAQIRLQQDTAAIRSEFPEIFNAAHPERAQEAHAWVDALKLRDQKLGRARSDLDIYREAGNLVYNQHNLSRPGSEQTTAPQAAQPSVQPRADVEERKRAAPRNPQAVNRRAVQPEPPRQPTGSETIAAMRSMYRQPALP